MPSFLSPLLARSGDFVLRDARTGAVLADHIELAGDSAHRRRGLLGRDGLDAGHVLVIAPCAAVHTFFMRFAIDVLFVKKSGIVVKCAHRVPPWRIAVAPGAYAAIECAAGTLERAQARAGDVVLIEAAPATADDSRRR